MKESLVFFGTGSVSLACLQGIENHFVIEAVITKPDKISPSGKPHSAPVKEWAAERSIPFYQPQNKQELTDLFNHKKFQSRLGLVVDYGLIIPKSVIDFFPLGIANSHFSLLPEWRGADPITYAILSGQKTTGVTIMLIVPALDEGSILGSERYEIPPSIVIQQLTHDLSDLSNNLLIDLLPKYCRGKIQPRPQQGLATYSAKTNKSDGLIDWTKPAGQIEREVRAFLGWPGSYTVIAGAPVIITSTHVICDDTASLVPGTAYVSSSKKLTVKCGQDSLEIEKIKPSGKREMSGQEFLAGHNNL